MRVAASQLSPIILAVAMLLFGLAPAVLGEELSDAERTRREVLQEWSRVSKGQTNFEVSDPELVPKFLAHFARQSGCVYEPDIERHPIRFMRIEGRRLSIIFCRPGISGSDQVFDLTELQKPRVVLFPVAAYPDGFGTTDRPGSIEYQQDTGIFRAEIGSDTSQSLGRYSYRYQGYDGFVVTRVEVKKDLASEWTTIWSAVPWNTPSR
ncbi:MULTISPECIES: hypothetical protein [unclassified Bradyrhizobium]|uniref:hypothetical protein n=1 Tax=unclassified Bradyrhizobium TaxID=2631580 RepID=UPI002915F69C|nr:MULTISPECIES: hypothetical protein [unclassified Bradyrhizobium]